MSEAQRAVQVEVVGGACALPGAATTGFMLLGLSDPAAGFGRNFGNDS